ncbi:4717_t:CDS:2 [Diversispora eburnea]|uniref:4717_t:CDS:1 n=1 Tax=Diversispora eburnea TaxID=1213867 RepID=A0A9N8YM24_9GLOM|nr:4717_t:CDS:2 [Diversispora eburnea]
MISDPDITQSKIKLPWYGNLINCQLKVSPNVTLLSLITEINTGKFSSVKLIPVLQDEGLENSKLDPNYKSLIALDAKLEKETEDELFNRKYFYWCREKKKCEQINGSGVRDDKIKVEKEEERKNAIRLENHKLYNCRLIDHSDGTTVMDYSYHGTMSSYGYGLRLRCRQWGTLITLVEVFTWVEASHLTENEK